MTQTARCVIEKTFGQMYPEHHGMFNADSADAIIAALSAAGFKIVAQEPLADEGEGTWWRAMRDAAQ